MPDDIRALQWAADEARRQSNEYMARARCRARRPKIRSDAGC